MPNAVEVRRLRLPVLAQKPSTRGECKDGPRPCIWISCRYHMITDVLSTGTLRPMGGNRFDDDDEFLRRIFSAKQTCALDVADKGRHTLDQIADMMNVEPERIRQIEASGAMSLYEAVHDGEE